MKGNPRMNVGSLNLAQRLFRLVLHIMKRATYREVSKSRSFIVRATFFLKPKVALLNRVESPLAAVAATKGG